jgi:hypothetical protein
MMVITIIMKGYGEQRKRKWNIKYAYLEGLLKPQKYCDMTAERRNSEVRINIHC